MSRREHECLDVLLQTVFANRRTPNRHRTCFGATPVNERNVTQGTDWNAVYRDRYNYQRDTVLSEALLAWRLNPLARRLVNLTKQYVTDGIEFNAEDKTTLAFLRELWDHPLNRIGQHLGEWSDELTLTGSLFLVITTNSAGMSYIRVFPTDQVKEIETASNDIQQETAYLPKATLDDPDPVHILNYWAYRNRKPKTVMLHYSVNKLAGMKWGEPDIAPLLPWLARYASWLEDRVRLNRFRQAYMFTVKGKYFNAADRAARQAELNANPPNPGSILVSDESEEWDVLSPKLESADANNDGLAPKKFIAGGQGLPLHWLAEPESSTRTTAEAAGTPTFKTLEDRQRLFLTILRDVLQIAVARRRQKGDTIPDAKISVTAADISERDNAALALAATQIISSFGQLWAANLIDADEYMRLIYRFAGEVLPAARPDNPSKPVIVPAGSTHPEWRIQLEGNSIFHNTEAGALPSTIDRVSNYTPINTSAFDGILSASDNNLQAAMETIDNHPSQEILFTHGCNQTIPASSTRYLEPVYDPNGFYTGTAQVSTPVAATLHNLSVRLNGAQPASGALVVTVLKDGVATTFTLTIPAGSAPGVYSDTATHLALAARDAFGYSF
jgi:hypothetical protein